MGIEKLADARGIVHRLMLQRGETVVEYGIGHMQVAIFEFCLADIIVEHLETVLSLLFTQKTVIETMTVIEQIVSRDDRHQQENQQDDSDGLVGL